MKHAPAVAMALLLALSAAGCNALSDAISEDPGNLLVLTVDPESIPADGASTSTLTALIPEGSDPSERVITFSTSAGTFVDGTTISSSPIDITADVRGVATVQLRSDLTGGTAIVRAEVGSLARKGSVHFVLAGPQQVFVSSDTFVLSVGASETAQVEATLFRTQGVPSVGLPVEWSARDSGGAPVGGFTNITLSDESGKATAGYAPGPTATRGDVIIQALVRDPTSGASVQGETTVQLVD